MKDNSVLPARRPANADLQSHTSPRLRILVVEDDSCIRRLSTEVLLHSGYAVDSAQDGADAWEAITACNYDLLVTDNNMPKVSGIELLKKVRASRMSLPVIMATGLLPMEDFTQNSRLQPVAVLLKPYTCLELVEMVHTILRDAIVPADNPRLPVTAESRGNTLAQAGMSHPTFVENEEIRMPFLKAEALNGRVQISLPS